MLRTTEKVPTHRKSTAERQLEIATAVLRLIGEQGLTSLTTTSIAAEVGFSPGALFRHFPSLDAMLSAAVGVGLQRMEVTFPDQDLPPLRRLRTLGLNRIELLGADKGLAWLLRSRQVYLTMPAPAVDDLRAMVLRSQDTILQALQEGIHDGTIRSDLPAEVLRIMFIGTVHTLIGSQGAPKHTTAGDTLTSEQVLDAVLGVLSAPTKSLHS